MMAGPIRRSRRIALGVAVLCGLTAMASGVGPAAAAGPRPLFQLPFTCGQTWNGNNDNSSAHVGEEIDFNRGGTADADLGEPVLAAAAGTIITSAHQGSVNRYGNLIVIDHGGGWRTYYAHLQTRLVSVGATVTQGQKIGTLGNTSAPGNNISPHLHYEVRTTDTSYPANLEPAYFNGVRFGYPEQNITSQNCGNPYTPTRVCGTSYSIIDSQILTNTAGAVQGTVYLLYDSGTGRNCVTTLKATSLGTATATAAYLEVDGSTRVTDSGNFGYYAGPVSAAAAGRCVRWGGSASGASYNSPLEHCG